MILLLTALAGRAGAQNQATVSAELNQDVLRPGDEAVLAVVVDVAEGYHAQSHRPLDRNLIPFTVSINASPAIEVRSPLYAEGHIEDYPALGRLSVYTGRVVTYVPLRVKADASTGELQLRGTVNLQICDDQMCYAPEELTFSLSTMVAPVDTPIQPNRAELFDELPQRRAAPTTQPAASRDVKAQWTMPVAFGAAFLAGLLFNIMPCVLPVLPIKAKGFYEVAHHRRGQAFVYGLVFSLGLISVFVVLALVVLVFQLVSWGELFSKPWFIWPMVGLLVLLSMGLFGSYDVNLPTFVYNFQPRHDTFGGNFFWGALMAILATPCTAPLLPTLLIWASTQPALVGVPAMIMVGVGMASPYILLSAFPELARGIPRSGPWAELFKQMLGFMMLAAAVYFAAGRIIPGAGFWWIVVAVIAIAALYLMARTVQLTKNAMPVAISSVLAVAMLGGSIWWTSRVTQSHDWIAYSTEEFQSARSAGKPVLVKFTANWCATCQVIEGTVFQDTQVWSALRRDGFVTLKVDLTNSNAPGKDLLLKLNSAGGIPLTAVYFPDSEEPVVLSSIYTSNELLEVLRASGAPAAAASIQGDR